MIYQTLKRAAGVTLMLGLAFAVQATPLPHEVVKTATDSLQADIAQNHAKYEADKAVFYKMVDERLVPYFDTRYIAQLILGPNLKSASPEQRTRFEAAFKNMLIRSYADALLTYHDSVKADVKPARIAEGANKATVNTTILRKDGPPVPIAFSMRLKDDSWKVYDIKVENLSLITNFRSQVDAQIKASSLDAVIQKLESGQPVLAKPDTDGDGA